MPWKKDLQRKQRELVILRKIWKLSQFDRSFQESWGNQESFRGPALKLGIANKAGTKPEESRISFPQIPNYFVPRLLIFFFFFKGQKTQPFGRAEEPFVAARRTEKATNHHAATLYINPQPEVPGTRRSDSLSLVFVLTG